MPAPTRTFTLPDLLSMCPLKGSVNPHYQKAAAESSAWINSYNVFSDQKRAFFIQGSNELLVSHTYPYADYEQFRTCCDFVNLLFVVDEAMRYADWDDGSSLSKMTKEFRSRFLKFASPGCYERFLKHSADYVDAVAQEAANREQGHVLDEKSFEALRRENSAIRLCFGLFEFVLGVDLPNEVFENSEFMNLYWAAADMICWSNDVYSYNMEQAKGHNGNNIVTVLMMAKGIGLQAASDLVGDRFRELMQCFTQGKHALPSWGLAVDNAVDAYVKALEHWVVGNLAWSFESQRYFGPEHHEVKRSLMVVLRPSEIADSNSD
ncbi:unnamed protein product [Somion occarium]|uniref:Terpene synthase n=1 Tax=Somion occarium TaxID=3059160 RepID=A0ABP1EBH3_9APHY